MYAGDNTFEDFHLGVKLRMSWVVLLRFVFWGTVNIIFALRVALVRHFILRNWTFYARDSHKMASP